MPAPRFTTNVADFQKLEGLYIFEKDPPGFIAGVNLSVVAVMGQTVRGPVNEAVEISSAQRFVEIYGSRDANGGDTSIALSNQVWRFLLNKPFGTVVVVRALAAAAVASSFNAEEDVDGTGTEVVTIAASSAGVWGEDVKVKVEDASDADATHWNLVVSYLGEETTYENLNTSVGVDNTAAVLGDDDANVVVLTKLADGRPANYSTITEAAFVTARDADDFVNLGEIIAAYTSVPGTEGTIAASDYTAANGAFDQIKERKGVSIVSYAEDDTTIVVALNAAIKTQSALVSDRMFVIWSGTQADDVATVVADVPSFRDDRLIYCYDSPFTLDPETGVQIQVPPVEWMCSILSQTDVDIHPGEEATKDQTAGIGKLTREDLTRENYISLRAAGISALERDADGGFVFVSGVTTSLTTGLTEITRRRMTDFLQLSASNRLKFFVKKKNTETIRNIMVGDLEAFSQGLQDDERVVEEFEVDNTTVNTANQRAQGIEKILWRVRLIGHILHLVLETEIGTGVTIEAA